MIDTQMIPLNRKLTATTVLLQVQYPKILYRSVGVFYGDLLNLRKKKKVKPDYISSTGMASP